VNIGKEKKMKTRKKKKRE